MVDSKPCSIVRSSPTLQVSLSSYPSIVNEVYTPTQITSVFGEPHGEFGTTLTSVQSDSSKLAYMRLTTGRTTNFSSKGVIFAKTNISLLNKNNADVAHGLRKGFPCRVSKLANAVFAVFRTVGPDAENNSLKPVNCLGWFRLKSVTYYEAGSEILRDLLSERWGKQLEQGPGGSPSLRLSWAAITIERDDRLFYEDPMQRSRVPVPIFRAQRILDVVPPGQSSKSAGLAISVKFIALEESSTLNERADSFEKTTHSAAPSSDGSGPSSGEITATSPNTSISEFTATKKPFAVTKVAEPTIANKSYSQTRDYCLPWTEIEASTLVKYAEDLKVQEKPAKHNLPPSYKLRIEKAAACSIPDFIEYDIDDRWVVPFRKGFRGQLFEEDTFVAKMEEWEMEDFLDGLGTMASYNVSERRRGRGGVTKKSPREEDIGNKHSKQKMEEIETLGLDNVNNVTKRNTTRSGALKSLFTARELDLTFGVEKRPTGEIKPDEGTMIGKERAAAEYKICQAPSTAGELDLRFGVQAQGTTALLPGSKKAKPVDHWDAMRVKRVGVPHACHDRFQPLETDAEGGGDPLASINEPPKWLWG